MLNRRVYVCIAVIVAAGCVTPQQKCAERHAAGTPKFDQCVEREYAARQAAAAVLSGEPDPGPDRARLRRLEQQQRDQEYDTMRTRHGLPSRAQ